MMSGDRKEKKQNIKKKKNLRKFHSLKHQISVLFIGLLLVSIFSITLINGLWNDIMYQKKWKCWRKPGQFFLR